MSDPTMSAEFMEFYSELMACNEGPVGNGLIGPHPTPDGDIREHLQRGFYTEAVPGASVVMFVALNPGTPLPTENAIASLAPVERVLENQRTCRNLFHGNSKRFFSDLRAIMSGFLGVPEEEVFSQSVFTNLVKQSTRQDPYDRQRFDLPSLELMEHGWRWLEREIELWSPTAVVALHSAVHAYLEDRIARRGIPYGRLNHPSFVEKRQKKRRDAVSLARQIAGESLGPGSHPTNPGNGTVQRLAAMEIRRLVEQQDETFRMYVIGAAVAQEGGHEIPRPPRRFPKLRNLPNDELFKLFDDEGLIEKYDVSNFVARSRLRPDRKGDDLKVGNAKPKIRDAKRAKSQASERKLSPRKRYLVRSDGGIPDDAVIEVITPGKVNTKRPNTAAFRKFDLLREYDGRTFAEFKSAADRHLGYGQPNEVASRKSWALGEVRWCIEKKLINLIKYR